MNAHDTNPHYCVNPEWPRPGLFIAAIQESFAALNARAEARFEEECIQFSRPLDKPPKVNEV